MPDLYMDVDAAVTVPVNILPIVDVDGLTVDAGVVYNEAGLDLVWNFVTTAGVQTHVAVTPTDTGGNYDWVNIGHGMYNIEIPASGGASANNDSEGFGWFTGKTTADLAWRGPIIGFRAAALNNALIDGGAYLSVNLVAGQLALKKNTAFANFTFLMVDSSGVPTTGLTVTATRRIDAGSFGACANAVSEVAYGMYAIDLAAADLNGSMITLRFTAAGASDRLIGIVTQA